MKLKEIKKEFIIPDVLDLRDIMRGEQLGIKQIRMLSIILINKKCKFDRLRKVYSDHNNARNGLMSMVEAGIISNEYSVFYPSQSFLEACGIQPELFFEVKQ